MSGIKLISYPPKLIAGPYSCIAGLCLSMFSYQNDDGLKVILDPVLQKYSVLLTWTYCQVSNIEWYFIYFRIFDSNLNVHLCLSVPPMAHTRHKNIYHTLGWFTIMSKPFLVIIELGCFVVICWFCCFVGRNSYWQNKILVEFFWEAPTKMCVKKCVGIKQARMCNKLCQCRIKISQ